MTKTYTLRQLTDLFFDKALHGRSTTTVKTYRWYLPKFLCEFGDYQAAKLKALDIIKYVQSRKSWKSQSTRATFDRCLRNVFNWAIRMGLIDRNPMQGIPAPSYTRRRDWTAYEFK